MPQLFQFPVLSLNEAQYDPIKFSYAIGQKCRTCNKKILHQQTISTCDCYRYCHEKCLLSQINQENKQKRQQTFKCNNCKKVLGISYKMDVITRPHINKTNIILIVLSLILISLGIYTAILFQNDIFREVINSFFLAIQASILAYAIVNSFIVRQFTAIYIKSTQLGLIISAFLELEKDLDDQMTNTELIR